MADLPKIVIFKGVAFGITNPVLKIDSENLYYFHDGNHDSYFPVWQVKRFPYWFIIEEPKEFTKSNMLAFGEFMKRSGKYRKIKDTLEAFLTTHKP